MANLLVIFGITGQQGSSVARHVLSDPELSQKYRVRGLTRDPSQPDAQAFQQRGIEVINCEVDDKESIKFALQGAHTVFAMTVSLYRQGGKEQEYKQGKDIADATLAAGVRFMIWSCVPSASKISCGRYPVDSYDVKDDIKEYIKTLPIQAAFYASGVFMQNFHTLPYLKPNLEPDGKYHLNSFVKPTTVLPLIDVVEDTGKFVGACLAEPGKFTGKTLCAATRTYTMTEVAEIIGRSSGKEVVYSQLEKDTFAEAVPEGARGPFLNMFSYFEEFGYFGAGEVELVAETAKAARGRPVEFEEYLKKQPLEF